MMKVRTHPRVAWRRVAGSTFVLQLDGRILYGLNDDGASVWASLDAAPTFDELIDCFQLRSPELEAKVVFSELVFFVRELLELGLVDVDGEFRSDDPLESGGDASPFNPRVLWQEKLEAVAASCAHFPGQSPVCVQAPQG